MVALVFLGGSYVMHRQPLGMLVIAITAGFAAAWWASVVLAHYSVPQLEDEDREVGDLQLIIYPV